MAATPPKPEDPLITGGHRLPRADSASVPVVTMARSVGIASGVAAASLIGGLLFVLVYTGWEHSFDSAIYVRSLWGVAHGSFWNSVRELHVLSVHFNLVLFLLAPVCWAIGAPLTLLLTQATAFGVTVAAAVRAMTRAMSGSGTEASWHATATVSAFLLVFCTPLLTNPFLFGLRPDLIGVPLLTIGLLRMRRRGDVDRRALLWMLSALIVREEFFMVIVGALVAAPFSLTVLKRQWKLRVIGCVVAVGWWATYWFGIRTLIGDGSDAIAASVFNEFAQATSSAEAITEARVLLLVAILGAGGGLALRGWRWLAPAGPGILFLFTVERMPELLLNVHYGQFVAPGLVVAIVAGFVELSKSPARTQRVAVPMIAAIGCAVFVLCSALPGGQRFQRDHFLLLMTAEEAEAVEGLRDLHALMASVPEDASFAGPYEVGALAAAREDFALTRMLTHEYTGDTAPEQDWIVLPARNWSSVGQDLVIRHNYRLVEVVPGVAALLTRAPNVPLRGIEDVPCDAPLAEWPDAGVALCSLTQDAAGQHHAVLRRRAEAAEHVRNEPLFLLAAIDNGAVTIPLLAARGMLPARDVPYGHGAVFSAVSPLPSGAALVLMGPNRRPLPARLPGADQPSAVVPIP